MSEHKLFEEDWALVNDRKFPYIRAAELDIESVRTMSTYIAMNLIRT